MTGPESRDPPHFTIFKTAAQEAEEGRRQSDMEGEAPLSGLPPAPERPATQSAAEVGQAIEELVFALYSEDVRMGIVRDRDVLDPGGGLSEAGGSHYYRRAADILQSLAKVPDGQIIQACAAEPGGTPRGAAARVELRRRGLTLP